MSNPCRIMRKKAEKYSLLLREKIGMLQNEPIFSVVIGHHVLYVGVMPYRIRIWCRNARRQRIQVQSTGMDDCNDSKNKVGSYDMFFCLHFLPILAMGFFTAYILIL